jgi:uncharacterized protein involved in exopolysaccharide biosynthesis
MDEENTPLGTPSWWWYLNVAVQRRTMIALVSLALAALVGTVTLFQPREYIATAGFMPGRGAARTSNLTDLLAQGAAGVRLSGGGDAEFYADLVLSRGVLAPLVTHRYEAGDPRPWSGDLLELMDVRNKAGEEAIREGVRALRRRMTVEVARTSGVVQFAVRLPHPIVAAEVAAGILDGVNNYDRELRREMARSEREFLERRLAEQRQHLLDSEHALSHFYERNRQMLRPGEYRGPELMAEEARLQRQVTLNQQLYLSLAQTLEHSRLEEVRTTPLIMVVERPEGFVMPNPRGTVRNAIIAFLVGAMGAVLVAFLQERVRETRAAGAGEYQQFERSLREATAWMKRRRKEKIYT